MLALEASDTVHVGVDSLNVVGHVERSVEDIDPVQPFELMNDGDILTLVGEMVRFVFPRGTQMRRWNPCPSELSRDGDLILLLIGSLSRREGDTVRVTKVWGHADGDMVQAGRVQDLDKVGNNAADEAADFGRRPVDPVVIDARRNLSGFAGCGILWLWSYIGSLLLLLAQWLIMMIR